MLPTDPLRLRGPWLVFMGEELRGDGASDCGELGKERGP